MLTSLEEYKGSQFESSKSFARLESSYFEQSLHVTCPVWKFCVVDFYHADYEIMVTDTRGQNVCTYIATVCEDHISQSF